MKSRTLSTLLIAISLSATALADEHQDSEGHHKPSTTDYALVLPGNLPHVLRLAYTQAQTLQLSETEKKTVQDFMKRAPTSVMAQLNAAEKLEQRIAKDILENGKTWQELSEQLAALTQHKQAATKASAPNALPNCYAGHRAKKHCPLSTKADHEHPLQGLGRCRCGARSGGSVL
jgi:hypothetical protein